MARLNIDLLPLKATPVGADLLVISDQAGGPATKKIAISTLPGGGGSPSKIAANGTQTTTFANDSTERVFFTLVIPGGTLVAGDLLRVQYLAELIAMASGDSTTRVRVNGTEIVSQLVTFIISATVVGFDFFNISVIDTGSGMSAARLVDDFNGLDLVFDATADLTFTFTNQFSIGAGGNQHRGLIAHLSLS